MLLGITELLVVVLFVVLLILGVVSGRSRTDAEQDSGFKALFQKQVTLTCWHCGQETDAHKPECQHCQRELK